MVALLAAALLVPAGLAGTSNDLYKQIRADLADNGRLDGQYNAEDVVAALKDATVQGYGNIVVVLPPPAVTPPPPPPPSPPAPQVCTEVAAGTPGAVQAPNGKWYTNAPNGNAAMCGPAAPAPQVCVEVAAGTPGAVQAPNGKWYTNAPNGNAEACGPAAATPPAPPAQPVGGTLPGEKTIVSQPKPAAQPTAKPQSSVAGQQSPLRQTRTTGTLPFTGAELLIFALIGAFLIGAGLLLRATSTQKTESP